MSTEPKHPSTSEHSKRSFGTMTAKEQRVYIAESELLLDDLDPAVLVDADRLEDLRALRGIVDDRARLEHRLAVAVVKASSKGRSWSEIAAVLGVSKQSAHSKYAERVATSGRRHSIAAKRSPGGTAAKRGPAIVAKPAPDNRKPT